MSDGTVYRAVTEREWLGRTVEGLALPWETWQVVRDLRGPAYPEAHARTSLDVTLRADPGPRPLFSMHEYAVSDPAAEPVGAVQFMRSDSGLMFRAWFSRTKKADEQRELVKDGAKRAVSVALDLIQSRAVKRPEGIGKLRTESRLKELSIAPTGFGQYPQAKILALRAEMETTTFAAGKHEGETIAGVYESEPAYLVYAATEHEDPAMRALIRDFLAAAEADDDEGATQEAEAHRSLVLPPARDQILRLRAGRPLLPSRNIDPPA